MTSTGDMIGGVLDSKYRLDAHLLKGVQSDLWAASNVVSGDQVHIKLIRPEYCKDPDAVGRYEREIALLSAWQHPNLLRVVDSGRTPLGVSWIAFEPTEGRLLSEDISDLALTPSHVARIGAQLARVLASAHQRGIIHRGLGPDTVMLTTSGDGFGVKVLDFGLAHLKSWTGAHQLTVSGLVGNMTYLSPEYITNEILDSRSDIYVLGLLVFEMLCGQPPFVGTSMRVAQKHVGAPPPPASHLSVHEVPAWMDALILAMLAKEPEDRPANMVLVADAFDQQAWP